MVGTSHDYNVFGDEEPTETHHKDCENEPESYPTGDSTETGVIDAPQHAVDEDEKFDRSCSCLDSIMGRAGEQGEA